MTAETKTGQTAFVVLVQRDGYLPGAREEGVSVDVSSFNASVAWMQVGKIEARSAEAAIREWVKANADGAPNAAVLVAVPARSWQPVKVSARVETTLVIEDVKA